MPALKKDEAENNDLEALEIAAQGLEGNIFEAIVENFPDVIQSVDAEGNLISVNKRAEELLGYSRDELIGMSIFSLYSRKVRKELEQGFADLQQKGFKDHIRSKMVSKDGTEIDVEIRSLSLYDKEGKFVKTFSIIRDMREIYALRSQVQQQSKLAAVGELAAGIMHDIRNPLTVILSYNDHFLLQAMEAKDWEKVSQCQSFVAKATNKIRKLSDHMRNYSRSEEDDISEILIEELINDALMMVDTRKKAAQANVEIHVAPATIILGRENQLEQVIINLLSNAFDALRGCENRTVYVRAKNQGDKNIIEIEDTGPGIPEKNKNQIFESFFTTKPKSDGTGLGLSICRGIVTNMNGELSVESEVGKGAKFIISLPSKMEPQ